MPAPPHPRPLSPEGRGETRRYARIALGLVLVLLALEVLTRAVLLPHSKDYVRFADYPRQAAELAQAPGLRVAFLGNSATQRGLDPAQFRAEMPAPVHTDLFLADASEIHTWYYMAKHLFWEPGHNPDRLVVTFFEDGLRGQAAVDVGRLAYAFTGPRDWPEVFAVDLPTWSSRTEFLLSSSWASYATRDRLRSRVLRTVVPGYKDYTEESNALMYRQAHKVAPPAPTYQALQRFLDRARAHHTRLCFVAFPMLGKKAGPAYELEPGAVQLLRAADVPLLDLREVPGILPEHYADDIHLKPAGAAIYTHHFTKAFAALSTKDTKKHEE